jgi:hypothetical protein
MRARPLDETQDQDMNTNSWLRPCALALAIALSTPARADTVPEQIERLQAQLESLQRQLDELKAAQRTSPSAAATPAPTPVATPAPAPPPASKPAPPWSDRTSVGGRLFANVSYIDQTSNGDDTDLSGYGIDVKRGYVTVDHKFDDMWAANVTTDFNYSSNDGETQVFIKKAYVQAKLADEAVFRLGSADMPWNPYAEGFYGFRYIDPTVADRSKFVSTADWGLHFLGRHGMVSYAASLVNGAGFKNPTRSDGMDFEARLGIEPVKGLVFAVGGYTGERGQDVASNPAKRTAERWDALATYGTERWRIGGEYFTADDWNTVRGPVSDSAEGWSLFGNVGLRPAINLFARYDNVEPKQDLDPTLEEDYWNFGIEWVARKGVCLAAVYKSTRLENDQVGAARVDVDTDEFGVFGDITF